MIQLSDYGKLLEVYRGTGILQMCNGDKLHCDFELAQTSDGRVYALCQIDVADTQKGLHAEALLLEGSTEDGKLLTFEEITIVRNLSEYKHGNASRYVVVYGRYATVRKEDNLPRLVRFVFHLTNFTMLGTESYTPRSPDGSTTEALQIPFTLNTFETALRRRREYTDLN